LQAFFCTLSSSETGVEELEPGLGKAATGLFSGAKKCAWPSDFFTQNPGSANRNLIV